MRDGERRAGEVFKMLGAAGSRVENQTHKARSLSPATAAGTPKVILLASGCATQQASN
jgi:hypothetical protein